MPRLSVDTLPQASGPFRSRVRLSIESLANARAEDLKRAKLLRREAKVGSSLIDAAEAKLLARKLERSGKAETFPSSLASSRYIRKQRIRLCSSLWEFVDGLDEPFTVFTLISGSWTTPADDLRSLDAPKLMAAVRSDLNRCGATRSQGAAFLALDNEFDVGRSVYQPHIHGLATGPMIDVVDSLRSCGKYQPVYDNSSQAPIHRPVQVKRAPLTDLPAPITYLLKRYCTCRWTGDGDGPPVPRGGNTKRLPEPFHSDWLLWMDQRRLSDLTLMMGMYVGSNGFALSK